MPETGGGSVWGDYDNDGDLDILGDYIYISDKGNFTNSNVPFRESSNFLNSEIMWIDYDNDGDLDIFCVGYYPCTVSFCAATYLIAQLYKNDQGTFVKVLKFGKFSRSFLKNGWS